MNLKLLRQQHGITQEAMAEKLGVSRPTYIQIEKGEKEPTISQAKILAELFREDEKKETVRKAESFFDPLKFKEVLLYVLEKVGAKPNIGETALYKLLYFIDFDFYEKYGKSLTGATYMKNHHGPTPRQFKRIIDKMITSGEIERVKSKYFQYDQKKYLPHQKANLGYFNAIEISHIDNVLGRLSDKNGSELRSYSHEDLPWLATHDQSDISYGLVFQRIGAYAQVNSEAQWMDASAHDILKELGSMSDEEHTYYQNLPEKK